MSAGAGEEFELRPATHDDYDAVAAFTENTWPDREGTDYIPRVYHDWIAGEDRETFLIDVGPDVAGIAQAVLLTDHEAWGQGMRVNPDYRGRNVAARLTDAVFEWSHDHGATVCRNMVFSWNAAGLGQARAAGFDPATEFRWATPDPDPEADPALQVREDPDAAWSAWARSDARGLLRGLALDLEESWAVAELTRDRLRRADDDGRVIALVGGDGTRAMTFRNRTRVFVPESARHVSDAARVRAGFSNEPDFVLEADLTAG